MTNTIVTYGGGDLLQSVFNALAMLLSPEKNVIHPLMIITISCGIFWMATKAFFATRADALFPQFVLPMLAIVSLSLIPTTSVYIEDKITLKSYKIDNVPHFLAFTTQLVSSMGNKLTEAVEAVMHTPNEVSYNKTGMIFGADTALDFRKYKISNPTLEQNLKHFAKQCVFYDLALKKYSLEQLKKSTDLWTFLAKHSSKVRMMPYTDPQKPTAAVHYVTCLEAIAKMTPLFEQEKSYHAAQDIGKHLPLTYQALTGLQKDSQELIGQQLMIHMISGELSPDKLAQSRAQTQQRSTYLSLGSLASSSLVNMRAILEALIYTSIILILPLSLLPGGMSFLTGWVWLMIWIQAWPPFYAMINYCMQVIAQAKAMGIFTGLTQAEKGLSLFTSVGLNHLYDDIYALSGYLAASIPFLSWAILKGGSSSFIHLAGSLMTPAHAAATAAAGEQMSGNYNLANVSMGQITYANTTGFQRNIAPGISYGSYTENSGGLSTTFTGQEMLLKHPSSEMRWNVSSDDSISAAHQTSLQNALSYSDMQQRSYMDSLSSHSRNMTDLTGHLSQSESYTSGISQREAYDVQESARYMLNTAKSMSEQTGISERDSLSMLMGTKQVTSLAGSLPSAAGAIGSLVDRFLPSINSETAISKDELSSLALNVASSDEFQTNYAKLTDFSTSTGHNHLNDEGVRLVEAVTRSLDEVTSSQMQYQEALSRTQQEAETASWAVQNAYQIRAALNQEMVNFASQRLGAETAREILTNGSDAARGHLIREFVEEYRKTHDPHLPQGNFEDPKAAFAQGSISSLDRDALLNTLFESTHAELGSWGIGEKDLNSEANRLWDGMSNIGTAVDHKVDGTRHKINSLRADLPERHEGKQDGWIGRVGRRGIGSIGKYAKDCLPLSWTKD